MAPALSNWVALALLMAAAAAILDAPGLLLVATVTLAYGSITRLWTRFGIQRISYQRQLGADRAVAGDSVPLDVTIWNRKPLPLPWVGAEDLVSEGLTIRERPLLERAEERMGREILDNAWALGWYERVIRHFHLDNLRRGVYEFGPVRLRVRDILGRDAVDETIERPATLVVGPRTVPVHLPDRQIAPLGDRRARRSLFADPALYGGVRPFQPGDSLRRVHWRATARLGTPVSRRYEPARGREVVMAVDVQTLEEAQYWDEEAFEELCIVAASLGRRLLDDGATVGLAAASYTGTTQRYAWLAPQAGLGHVSRIEGLLARIGPLSSGPFGSLLTWMTRRVPPGATVTVLSARDPRSLLGVLRRLRRSGYAVQLVSAGPDGQRHVVAARRAGLDALSAQVTPNARAAEALLLAG